MQYGFDRFFHGAIKHRRSQHTLFLRQTLVITLLLSGAGLQIAEHYTTYDDADGKIANM